MEASQIANLPQADLKKVLLYLHGYQTDTEQVAHSTEEQNGVGFNKIDADILSSFAEQVKSGRDLSDKQYNILKLRLPKYHRQVGSSWEHITLPETRYTNGRKPTGFQIEYGASFETKGGTYSGGQGGELSAQAFDQAARITSSNPLPRVAHVGILDKKTAGRLFIDEKGCLAFTPNVYPSKQIKDIGFKSWDGPNKTWHQFHPKVTQKVVDEVVKLFGVITIDPSVEEALKPIQPVDLPDWVNADFPTLKPFQKEAIQFVAAHDRLLLALAPRLGKTVVTVISADVVKAERILVVAPLSLLRDWKKKILKWSPHTSPQDVAIIYKKNLPVPARWSVTNYDTLRLHPETFNMTNWDLIIVDETLLIKNRKAHRTQWVFELINKKLPMAKRKAKEKIGDKNQTSVFAGKSTPPKYVWFLSGAPRSKLYTDMWAQLNILAPNEFTSYWRFAEDYCVVEATQWSNYNIVGDKADAASRIQKDLAHIFYTRSHADVTDIPPMEPEDLGVPMSTYQDKMYGQMEAEFLAELSENDTLLAPNILSQMTRLVQLASNPLLVGGKDESAKWDALIEMLQFEIRPIIVWTSFIKTVEELELRLAPKEVRVARLTGATKQEDRGAIVEAFQDNRVDVLIAHPAVGKYGLDLFNAKSVIYLERNYIRDDYYQSLMRVVQVDMKEAPHIVHLMSLRKDGEEETVDQTIGKILSLSTEETKKLTTVGLKKLMGVLK